LFDAGERLLREYRRRLPHAPPPFSFGSWIGGDLDGNPEVDRETILAALERARESVLARYRDDVRDLSVALSSSRAPAGGSAALEESIAGDARECVGYRNDRVWMMSTETYRQKLSYVWWRLENDGYDSPEAFAADLAVIRRSLEANRGARVANGPLAALERRIALFGFHVAKLDVRLPSSEGPAPTERPPRVFEAWAA